MPKEFKGLDTGHMATHQLRIDDFCTAACVNKIPTVNAWVAARYTIPGIIAHESALSGGKTLAVPDYGDAPEEL